MSTRLISTLLLLAAIATVGTVRSMPGWRHDATQRPDVFFTADNGKDYLYPVAYDPYTWLRMARNQVDTGSPCDEVRDGQCRDNLAYAPVGTENRYADSLHVDALAWLYRLQRWFDPGYPLEGTALWLTVLVGMLGVPPTFWIAARFGGPLGGFAASLLVGLDDYGLMRSVRADTDVWNIVVPIWVMWAVIESASATNQRRRLSYALAASLLVVLQAHIWSGYLVTYFVASAAFLAVACLHGCAAALRRWWPRLQRRRFPTVHVKEAALAAVAFFVGVEVASVVAGDGSVLARVLPRLAAEVAPAAVPSAGAEGAQPLFPENFSLVTEVGSMNFSSVVALSGGATMFQVAWAALLVLAFGHGRLLSAVPGLAIGLVAWNLVDGAELERLSVVALLAVPVGIAAIAAVVSSRTHLSEATKLVALAPWFLGTLYVALSTRRFYILFAPALGIVLGAGIGWLHRLVAGWVEDWTQGTVETRARVVRAAVHASAFALVLWFLGGTVRGAEARVMRTYPRVNDIWHETLTEIRDRTPADTIVNAWWDYGYFIKYYAERRVSADGASLLSRVPQRIGQALLASTDREAVGWLRMLNCGSDASSEPEGERGAYARLVAAGLTPTEAEAMLPQLVRANRDGAEKILLGKRLGRRSRLPVLEATHCTPPDSVLLLSSEMIRMPAWWYLGGWDTTHAWIEQQVSGLDRPAAVARLRELAYGETEAEAILDQIERGQFGRDASKFVANASPYLVGHWIACQADASGRRRCPMGQVSGGNKVVLDSFTYDPQAPEEGVFLIGSPAGGQLYRARPSAVLVAGPTSLERRDSESHQAGPLLVDTVQHRILVGPLYLLESTFTRLVFLEGRYSGEHFTSFSDRVGAAERLFAYRIGWDSDPESAR